MKSVKPTKPESLFLPAELTPKLTTDFINQLQSAIGLGTTLIRVDCSQVENATSNHIGILWKAFDICRTEKVRFVLEEATAGLKKVLVILDLGELFGIDEIENKFIPAINQKNQLDSRIGVFSELISVTRNGVKTSLDNFLAFLREHNVPESVEMELRTVLYELLTNVIDHSELGENDNVKVMARIEINRIILTLEDTGKPFDPTSPRGPKDLVDLTAAAKDRQFKGFGLMMIRKMVDNILYRRKEDIINYVQIEKSWS